jgi:hypothetical protein
MITTLGSVYQGQWFKGQKCGYGKYYDKSS